MSNKNKGSRLASLRVLGAKAVTGASALVASGAAFAQGELPADLATADTFMTTAGLVAVGIAAAVTLVVIGIRAAKLPRQGA